MKDYHNFSNPSTSFSSNSPSLSNDKPKNPFPCGYGQLPDTPEFKRLIGALPKSEICWLLGICSSRNHRIPCLTSYPLSDDKIAEDYGLALVTVEKARRSLARKGIITTKMMSSGKRQCTLNSDYLRDQKQEKTSQTGCENIPNRMQKHPKQDENSASKNGSNPRHDRFNGTSITSHPDSNKDFNKDTPSPIANGNGNHTSKNGKNEEICKDLKNGEKPKDKNKARSNTDLIETFSEYTDNPPEDEADSKMDEVLEYVYDTFERRYHGVDFRVAARDIVHLAITKYLLESDHPVRFISGIHQIPQGKNALRSAFNELNPRRQTEAEAERQDTRDLIAEITTTGNRPNRGKKDNWTNPSDILTNDQTLAQILADAAGSEDPNQTARRPKSSPRSAPTHSPATKTKKDINSPQCGSRNLSPEATRAMVEEALKTQSDDSHIKPVRKSRADVSDEDKDHMLDQDAAD